jgi:hypothetical protein
MPEMEGTDRHTRRGCNGQSGQDKNCVRCVADRVDWSGQTETESEINSAKRKTRVRQTKKIKKW